jgi:hypothetical protein
MPARPVSPLPFDYSHFINPVPGNKIISACIYLFFEILVKSTYPPPTPHPSRGEGEKGDGSQALIFGSLNKTIRGQVWRE